ncbi:hypothetical protein F5Y13DRAFT_176459 [Hypoxylon sp. FL1857]|nr:hypothetical protein F5Y13DRAFT_176459 [Hypoxylon sp. FL1857]
MAPQEEKLGDAITVKTPLSRPSYIGEKSEKRQLSDKKTARKTTSSSSSKAKPISTAMHNPDPRSSLDRVPVADAALLDQRPLKRPRLTTDADKKEQGARHQAPSFADNVLHASFGIKPAAAERDDLASAAASDFALRPKKGSPPSMEIPPRPKSREDRVTSISRPQRNDPSRKHQATSNFTRNHGFPANGVIDLTEDDDPQPQLSNKDRQGLHSNAQNSRNDRTMDSRAPDGPAPLDLPHEGKSIEVQFIPNQRANVSTGPVNASSRNGQSPVRKKISSNPAPRQLKRSPPNIAPRPVRTLLSPDSYNSHDLQSAKLFDDKKNTQQQSQPQQPQPPAQRPVDAPRQNGVQVRQTGPVTESVEEPRTFRPAVINHLPTAPMINHSVTAPPDPGPITTLNTMSASGGFIASRFAVSAEVNQYVQDIKARNPKPMVNGTTHDNSVTHSGVSIPQPEPKQMNGFIRASQSRESGPSKTQDPFDQQVPSPHAPLPQHGSVAQEVLQHPVALFQERVGFLNGTARPDKPAIKPTLGSKARDPNWRHQELEKKRQVLISKHDPAKFDSYIYNENNEPFRPGSALFGLPPKLQPPRPTRPAIHFAHIDPRTHWTHPRSEKWHREKQKEIHERGTRKRNFGQAAARAAKRKRKNRNTIVELPDRVTNNPQWIEALYELDEMAEQYHAQRRKDYKDRKECEEHLKKMEQKRKESYTIVRYGCEDEQMENVFDERKHFKTLDDGNWSYIRRA